MQLPFPRIVNERTLAPYVRYVQEVAAGDNYRVPPRVIYDHEIIFVLQGQCEYSIEGERVLLKAGDVHLMPPLVRHHCRVPDGASFHYYAVHFDPVYMGEELDFSADDVYARHDYQRLDRIPDRDELFDRPGFEWGDMSFPYAMPVKEPAVYAAICRRMLQAFAAKRHGYPLVLRACLLELLAEMAVDLRPNADGDRSASARSEVSRVIALMEAHLAEPFDLEAAAESVYLAPNYLRSLFKTTTGRTPLAYLTHLRMERAKELLLASTMPIGEVAAGVGYPDIHHFSKLFKKLEGLPPSQYRDTLSRF